MTKPKLRFPDFTGEWDIVKLNQITERVTRKNSNNKCDLPLTISAQMGLIDQKEFYDKRIASKDVSGYYLIKNGEFAYNKSTSLDAPFGAVKRLDKYDQGVLSTLYIVFKINDENKINSDFLSTYYDAEKWHREVKVIAVEGSRAHGLLNITPKDFFETCLVIPNDLKEQQRIGSFFSEIDNYIYLNEEKLTELQSLKKSLMQKMFPKDGEVVPEIRFPGFDGEWETYNLENLCDLFTDGDWIEAKDQSDTGIRLIQTGNIGTTIYLDKENNKKWISEEVFKKLHCEEVLPGDILISRLPEPAGRACIIPELNTKMITAVDCTILRTSEKCENEYLVQYLSTPQYFKTVRYFLGGGTRQRISRGNLSEIKIPLPKDIEEQQKIGSFFKELDNRIELQKQKLDEIKEYKKGLLQQMFC